MKKFCLLVMLSLVLSACASPGLEYKPSGETAAPVSAVHHLTADRFYVEIASDGYRVEEVTLVMANGTQAKPETIHHPAPARQSARPSVGVGVSAGVMGRNAPVGGGVGIQTGAGQYGNTIAVFPRARIGNGPWTVRIKLSGFAPTDIKLPALGMTASEDASS